VPKRTDLDSILIIGAGPIIIGQACEFDYSGAQACKALKEEGYRVVLVNSNPATIMTDPETADAIYIEPINWRTVARIIEKERPTALLPTMGGQTALNTALDLVREGVLDRFNVELIGASQRAIDMAEDRELFRRAMADIGLETARARIAHSMEEALAVQSEIGFPTVIRPSFTLGGSGGGIAYNREEFEAIVARGLDASPTNEVLLEESVLGWKEYEMEVVRDRNDNCIIVCSIENLDPMGVHTGDSITVAPAQTLTDREYQRLRDASIAVLRKIGVDTGGSNVQFAINPDDGRVLVIEMNPRVSRSSALASKATGFPIAKIAAKLAVGYTLDELKNEITGGSTPASFEPTIDYVVTKIPRFTFEKFPGANTRLNTPRRDHIQIQQVEELAWCHTDGREATYSLSVGWGSRVVSHEGVEPGEKSHCIHSGYLLDWRCRHDHFLFDWHIVWWGVRLAPDAKRSQLVLVLNGMHRRVVIFTVGLSTTDDPNHAGWGLDHMDALRQIASPSWPNNDEVIFPIAGRPSAGRGEHIGPGIHHLHQVVAIPHFRDAQNHRFFGEIEESKGVERICVGTYNSGEGVVGKRSLVSKLI